MESENQVSRKPRSSALSAEEKARIIGLYGESGLTHVEFWRREGVSLFNFQRWLGKRKRTGEAHFVEVESRAIAERGRYRMGLKEEEHREQHSQDWK